MRRSVGSLHFFWRDAAQAGIPRRLNVRGRVANEPGLRTINVHVAHLQKVPADSHISIETVADGGYI